MNNELKKLLDSVQEQADNKTDEVIRRVVLSQTESTDSFFVLLDEGSGP